MLTCSVLLKIVRHYCQNIHILYHILHNFAKVKELTIVSSFKFQSFSLLFAITHGRQKIVIGISSSPTFPYDTRYSFQLQYHVRSRYLLMFISTHTVMIITANIIHTLPLGCAAILPNINILYHIFHKIAKNQLLYILERAIIVQNCFVF